MKWMEGRSIERAIEIVNREERSSKQSGETRRDFIKMPIALAAGSIVAPLFLDRLAVKAEADQNQSVTIAPRYYPVNHFKPQVDLTGKLAVITGASRGNGRAVAEALTALGVKVIGTSRNPVGVPNP